MLLSPDQPEDQTRPSTAQNSHEDACQAIIRVGGTSGLTIGMPRVDAAMEFY
jgi:hypothetical protein